MTLRPYSADLQQRFREVLKTAGAPEGFDDATPVSPVAVVAGITSDANDSGNVVKRVIGPFTTTGSDQLVYTIPSGRVFYVTFFRAFLITGAGGLFDLKDNTIRVSLGTCSTALPVLQYEFGKPGMLFNNNITIVGPAASEYHITIGGYELTI